MIIMAFVVPHPCNLHTGLCST